MLLVIDSGNTNTSLGVFNATELVAHWRLTTARSRTVDEYGIHARNLFELAGLDFKTINAIAIASVVPPLNYTLKTMAETYFNLTPLFVLINRRCNAVRALSRLCWVGGRRAEEDDQ